MSKAHRKFSIFWFCVQVLAQYALLLVAFRFLLPGVWAGQFAAGSLALDDDRAQPFRGAVDRGGETGRSRPDDDRVVLGGAGGCLETEEAGEVARLRAN